jgi:hypothetical protein
VGIDHLVKKIAFQSVNGHAISPLVSFRTPSDYVYFLCNLMLQVNNPRRTTKIYNVKTAGEGSSNKAGDKAERKIMLLPQRADRQACYF